MLSSIGSKIKGLRLQNNVTQNDLCGDCLSRVILSKIENNKMLPSIPQLIYISDKLGKPTSYFLSDFGAQKALDKNTDEEKTDFETLYMQEHFYDIVKSYEFNNKQFSCDKNITKYYYIGMSYFNMDIYHESLKHLKKYLSFYEKAEYSLQEKQILLVLNTLNTLFKIMLKDKNYAKGKTYLLIAKKYLYLYNAQDTLLSFMIHNNLAYIYYVNIEFDNIINLLDTFLSSHQKLLYVDIVPYMYISLNIAYYNTDDYEKSIIYINKAIHMFLCQENYSGAGKCYLNYINALRYSKKFDEALIIVKKCKEDYKSYETLYNRFLIQEMIIYINLNNYKNILQIVDKVNLNALPKISKCNYYFILGIAETVNQNFKEAHNYLLKCEKVFIKENYTYDLNILYEALYVITGDIEYKDRAIENQNIIGRKNIIINTDYKITK